MHACKLCYDFEEMVRVRGMQNEAVWGMGKMEGGNFIEGGGWGGLLS